MVVLTSCKKKAAIEVDPNFCGHWVHYEPTKSYLYYSIFIYDNGEGTYFLDPGAASEEDDQYIRDAFVQIENDILFIKGKGKYRWSNREFAIDQFPTQVDTVTAAGQNCKIWTMTLSGFKFYAR